MSKFKISQIQFQAKATPIDNSMYATIDDPGPTSVRIENDGYIDKNNKSKNFDSDYEKMMEQRGEMMPNKRPVM